MSRLRVVVTTAAVALVAGVPGAAEAHEVRYLGLDADVGVSDLQGFTWTLEVKARVRCSNAAQSHLGVTFTQLRSYRDPGGDGALYLDPAPNAYGKGDVFLGPGLYEIAAPAVACNTNEPEPDGHVGSHAEGAENVAIGRIDLPACRRPVRAAMRLPLVPLVRRGADRQAVCPARPCDAVGVGSTRFPLVPVIARGPAVPAPCPTVEVRERRPVPIQLVCGPGAVASRPSPLLPVRGAPCRGAVELVGVSAGAARASAARVLGRRRFKIKRGSYRPVRVPLRPEARTLLRQNRFLRVRAVVRSKAGRRQSEPFLIVARG